MPSKMQIGDATPEEALPLLRQTELRKCLSDSQLTELERFCRTSQRKPGTTLFRQGEPAEALFLVAEGSIELRARPPGRRVYRTVEFVQPNCTFGDEALFGEDSYLMSARVMEPAKLLVLLRSSFEHLSEQHPDVAVGVLRCSGSCLLQTIRRSAILTQSPAEVGLRQLLLELARANGGAPSKSASLRITHAQLAGVLHLSRETVSRMLAQMASEGVVELGRGAIRFRQS
jgi:CRP/FNR family cyclic AMP-dependent transcriptional regulator